MLRLKRVAITGTIASGKSTVLNILKALGAYTVDADKLLHAAFSNDISLRQQLERLFGVAVFLPHGDVNRAYIAEEISRTPAKAVELERICHPYLLESLDKLYRKVKSQSGQKCLFVAEVPLLFESTTPFKEWFDITCAIYASDDLCKKRFLQEREDTKESAEIQFSWRRNRQLPGEQKKQKADYVIENRGTLDELRQKTKDFFDWSVSTS